MKYEVKGCKDHKGHEGEKLTQCNLYRDGKKVAFYSDGDWGGPAMFQWVDRAEPRVKITIVNLCDETVEISVTPEEAMLYEHIKDMKHEFSDGKEIPVDPEIYVSELIEDFMQTKHLKKICKKRVYFRLKDEEYEDDDWTTINVPYSAEIKQKMVERYGDNLGEILNETIA
jgi:hypothetical protein